MVKRVVLIGLAAALVMPVLATQDQTFGDEIRRLLQEGTDLYKRGKYEEASSKYEEAFQMKPNSDQVYAFIKRAGEDIIAGMMNSPDRKMQDVGRRLFELAKPGEPLREGKAIVLKYIEDLKSDRHVVWRNAFFHLKNFGPYCIRFVIPALADQQQDRFRARVLLLLTEMSVDGSLAVVEALDSKNPFVRQQAAIVLGNIKDERAIPALRRVTEDANEPPEVKKFANESLRKIIRVTESAQWKKATDYYYMLAMKFYYSHSTAILSWQRSFLIWKWDVDNDRLTERKVARMLFNEQLAEEALYDLLELDPDYTDQRTGLSAWSLLACVHFAQALEAEGAARAAVEAFKVDEIDKNGLKRLLREIEGVLPANSAAIDQLIDGAGDSTAVHQAVSAYFASQAKIIRANVLAQLPGKQYVYEALSRSLTDGNYLVAKSLIETIGEMGRPEDLPAPPQPGGVQTSNGQGSQDPVAGTGSAANVHGTIGFPLIEALTNEDKRVRYAAARAMVRINPQRRKLGMELVIPNLIDAIGEQGVRVALVIYDIQSDQDRNFINGFKKTLNGIGVFPMIVTTGAEGIVKAKQFPTEDVIIIQKKICSQIYFREADTSKQIVETVFDTLRDDVRTRNIPRIVLGDSPEEKTAADKEYLEKGTAQGTIDRRVHKLDLKKMLDDIFDLPEAKKDAKDRADEIAKNAAESFASIDPTNTLYPYRDAVQALIKTVGPEILREDFIRIPAAQALGHFGDQRGIDVLAKVVSDKDDARAARQKGVRLASSKAISEIFKQTGVSPSQDVYEVLKKYTLDGDYDIEFTCGEALGNATLTNAQRLDLSKHRRIKRETVSAEDD